MDKHRIFQNDLKKKFFCRNIDIYGFMGKKRFVQNVVKNRVLHLNVDIYGDADKRSQKRCFRRYIDIAQKKNDF